MTATNFTTTINRNQLQSAIKMAIHTHENIMVVGPPGCGKTEITEQTSQEITPYTAVATPAVEDPTAAAGMPVKVTIDKKTKVRFLPFKLMDQLVNHDPDDDPFVVILDDFGQAPRMTQASYM